ncbi:MAG TPA: efflux RND transporter periplasmic adaptor subunit [Candidatus Binataceae bacterium]
MADSPRSPNIRELESLRIARAAEPARKRRLLPLAILAVVLAVLGIAGYEVYVRTVGSPPEVQTAFVTVKEKGQAGVLLTGSGYVVTQHKYISIGTVLLGKIVAEPIEEGQIVKKGDILARIDDRNYHGLYDQAVADRDLADANVKLDLAEAMRERELYKAGVTSQDELDTAENKLLVAQATLERAHASVASAKYYQDETVIRSPINGIVLKKYHEVGDTINYGAQAEAGAGVTDIAQLADTEDMRAEVDINESDIAKVAIGTPAQVVPDAYPDMPFSASVVKIYPAADRQKGTVKVEVHILQPDLKIIKPEMSAKVTFLASGAQKAEKPLVLVPKKAVVGDQAAASVWVVRDGVTTRVPITLGREFQEGVEVRQGLTGGEQVIVVPPPNLREGEKVTPVATS